MSDRFQGDPKISIDGNGADLTFRGGQPIMDYGLENAAIISLHTREGWCGNTLLRTQDQVGSPFEEALEQPITLASNANVRNAGNKALNWMLDAKIASRIEVVTRNPKGHIRETVAIIIPIARDMLALMITKYGSAWIAQKLEPAHLRT